VGLEVLHDVGKVVVNLVAVAKRASLDYFRNLSDAFEPNEVADLIHLHDSSNEVEVINR
jgi:hypothetical protein